MRNKLVLWLILLVVGFLGGFIPQYSRSRTLNETLTASKAQLDACRSGDELSELRDTAALMYLEATQKNYGTSAGYATRFFEQAQRLLSNSKDETLRGMLRDLSAGRDQITADLAKGDAGVVSEMQPMLSKVLQDAKR